MRNKPSVIPRTSKEPVHIRRNVESFTDPYIEEEHLPEFSVCRVCGSVSTVGRWYPADQAPKRGAHEAVHHVVCPACRKLQDKVPSGVLTIAGDFVRRHKDEILNLIRNESAKALGVNPLERVMSLEEVDDGIEVTTTNEKLAQRIGKALHHAYSGSVEYKWSGETKLARVVWRRDW